MARLLRALIRKPTSTRFISSITHQNPPIQLHLLHPLPGQPTKFDHGGFSFLNPKKDDDGFAHFGKTQLYPSFSLGFFLDPVLSNGSGPIQAIGTDGAQSDVMWADSVKKKRKKKMNKHKYKKLRKRLRRKTKT